MFDFIVLLSAIIFLAVKLKSDRPSITFPRKDPSCTSMVSRYFTIALVSFHGLTFARMRVAGRVLRQAGMKLLACARVFCGRPYISEMLMSVFISIVLLGSFTVRRLARRLSGRVVKLEA